MVLDTVYVPQPDSIQVTSIITSQLVMELMADNEYLNYKWSNWTIYILMVIHYLQQELFYYQFWRVYLYNY